MEKLHKICRVCCENSGEIIIFEQYDETPISAKLLRCCSNLHIDESDVLAQYICRICEEELSITYRFILKCESAVEKFRNLYSQNIKYEYDSNFEIKEENTDSEGFESGTKPNEYTVQTSDVSVNVLDSKIKKKCLKNSSLTCKECNKKCANQSNFIIHMKTHSNEKPFACHSCDKKYKDKGGLKRHIDNNHVQNRIRNFMCDHCGKGFYSKNELKVHQRIHTGEAPYACTMCPKKFTQLGSKERHQKIHKGVKSYTCVTCKKKFGTQPELNRHYSVHSLEKKYSCVVCNALFKYKGNMKTHMKQHVEQNKFVCGYCGLPFNTKGNLKTHINRKHSSKAGWCSVCETDVSNINIHMCRHSGHRPFNCEHCPKRCFTKQSLAYHMNFKHSRTDRFQCVHSNCALSFPSKTMLNHHVAKQHENIKPHGCTKCSRKFYRKSDLTRHTMGTHKLTTKLP